MVVQNLYPEVLLMKQQIKEINNRIDNINQKVCLINAKLDRLLDSMKLDSL